MVPIKRSEAPWEQAVASALRPDRLFAWRRREWRATEDGHGEDSLTAKGFAKLDAELKKLKSVERPAVIEAIAEAREHGDLSENAEYHAAREKQSFVEGRIRELDAIIGRSEVIDPSRFSGAVKFGATVAILDEDTDEEKTFQIVGEQEADIEQGLLT